MKALLHIALILAAGVFLGSCTEQRTVGSRYEVTCRLDSVFGKDSATLWVVEPDYNRLRLLSANKDRNGQFLFTGWLDQPHVAIIKFDNDSLPFYFVLEPGITTITINRGGWIIHGGPQCQSYMRYMNRRQHIIADMQKTWKAYRRMAGDSTLKRRDEEMLFRHDSLLLDSLQRLTVERINRGDRVSRIVAERFINTLDSAHLSRVGQ